MTPECPCCGFKPGKAPIRVDLNNNVIHYRQRSAQLSPTEAEFAAVLARRAGKSVQPESLLAGVWPNDDKLKDPTSLVRIYAHKLKKKIRPIGLDITSHWGTGYQLAAYSSVGSTL